MPQLTQEQLDAFAESINSKLLDISAAIKHETDEIKAFIETHTGNLDTSKLTAAIDNLNGIAGNITTVFTPPVEEPAPEPPVEEPPVEEVPAEPTDDDDDDDDAEASAEAPVG